MVNFANVYILHTSGSAGLRDYHPILIRDSIGSTETEHREYVLDNAE